MKKLLFSVIFGISLLGTSRNFAAGEGPGQQSSALMSVEDGITAFTEEYGLTDAESKSLASELERLAPQGQIDPERARSIAQDIAGQSMPPLTQDFEEQDFEEIEEKSDMEQKEQASAAEKGAQRLTVDQAVEKYAHALSPAQHDAFEQQLSTVADQYGFVDIGVARDIFAAFQAQAGPQAGAAKTQAKQQVKKNRAGRMEVEDVFRSKKAEFKKGLPDPISAEVLQRITEFLPAGYVVPLEWNVKFPKGTSIQEFAKIKNPRNLVPGVEAALAASADGRKVALRYAVSPSEHRMVTWDMQNSPHRSQVKDDHKWPFPVSSRFEPPSLAPAANNQKYALIKRDGTGYLLVEFREKMERYAKAIALSNNDTQMDRIRKGLSPYGRRFCISLREGEKFVTRAFDVMTGKTIILEEGTDGYQGLMSLGRWVNWFPLGIAFSPTGRYVMWAIYNVRPHSYDIVIKIADLNQLFGNDEYEMEQAEARADKQGP
jgi:hypothetical protein